MKHSQVQQHLSKISLLKLFVQLMILDVSLNTEPFHSQHEKKIVFKQDKSISKE